MKLILLTFLLFSMQFGDNLAQLVSQQELMGVQSQGRYKYICGSDPYRFFSEFPCNMFPVCPNGGFKLNVGCFQDYQCTPYSANAVCINSCCCSVPRIVDAADATQRFFDNSVKPSQSSYCFILAAALVFLF